MLKREYQERQIPISTTFGDGTHYFRVAQYEFRSFADFKEKLTQFPKGTAFTANSFSSIRLMNRPLPSWTISSNKTE